MPAYSHSDCSFHSTHIHKPTTSLIYTTSFQHSALQVILLYNNNLPTDNPTSQCLPWSNSLPALALLQTGLCLLFPSEPSITLDESKQSHQHNQRFKSRYCLHARRAYHSIHLSAARFRNCTCIDLDCILQLGTFEHSLSLDPHLFNSKHDPQHAWLHPHRQRKSSVRQPYGCACPLWHPHLLMSMQLQDDTS
jgi:hypothetical protein